MSDETVTTEERQEAGAKTGIMPLAVVARVPWRSLAPVVALSAVAAVFLWRVRAILPPFIIALFLAALLDPVVSKMVHKGMPRSRAVASIFAMAILSVVLAGVLVLPPVVSQLTDLATNMGSYVQNLTTTAERMTARADRWYGAHQDTMRSLGINEAPSAYISKQAGPVSSAVRDALDSVKNVLVSLLGQVLWLIIIPLSVFYFLLDYPLLRARIAGLLPVSRKDDVDRMIQEVVEVFSAYVRGLTKVCVFYGAGAALLFWILRLRYGLFLGVAAGALYAVPYVGPAIAVFAIVLVALTTAKGIGFVLLVVALFLIMHVTFDYGVTPRVVGGSVGLHPLVNIFALMCGVAMFGVWGMLLAVPVAASVQRLLMHLYPGLAGSRVPSVGAPPPTPDSDSVEVPA